MDNYIVIRCIFGHMGEFIFMGLISEHVMTSFMYTYEYCLDLNLVQMSPKGQWKA